MSNQFVGSTSLSLPDRRVLMKPALEKDIVTVISKSSNADAGMTPTTILRPGTILIAGASDGLYWDDESGGQASAPATVLSSEDVDSDWASTNITIHIDGVSAVTVAMPAGGSGDEVAEIVAALNAAEEFRALAVAAASTLKVRITLLDPERHLKVTSDLSSAFGASGQSAFPTEADVVVITDYCNQTDPFGNAINARVAAVRAGVFDESNLLWQGAAATSSYDYVDMKRILKARGSRFE